MRCIVKNCFSTEKNASKRISFHSFPSDGIQRNIWIKRLNINCLKDSLNQRVCSKHFNPKDVVRKFKKKKWLNFLKDGALPVEVPHGQIEPEIYTSEMDINLVSELDNVLTTSAGIETSSNPNVSSIINAETTKMYQSDNSVRDTNSVTNPYVKIEMETCSKSQCLSSKNLPVTMRDTNVCGQVRVETSSKAECSSTAAIKGSSATDFPCVTIRVQTCYTGKCFSESTFASETCVPYINIKVETCSRSEWLSEKSAVGIFPAEKSSNAFETSLVNHLPLCSDLSFCTSYETLDMEEATSNDHHLAEDTDFSNTSACGMSGMEKVHLQHPSTSWDKNHSCAACGTSYISETCPNDSLECCSGFTVEQFDEELLFEANEVTGSILNEEFHEDQMEVVIQPPRENAQTVIPPRKRKPYNRYDEESCILSYYTAKYKKPFGDVAKWMEVSDKLLKALNHHEAAQALQNISFSRFKVAKCLDELNMRAVNALKEKIQKAAVISIALDEASDMNHKSHLIIFVRGVLSDSTTFEEMLDMKQLLTTTGKDVLDAVMESLVQYDALRKLFSVTTDGAPAMSGKHQGFYGLLRAHIPDLRFFHCLLHQENLCAQRFDMKSTVSTAVKLINRLRGGHNHTTHRLLRDFLSKRGARYQDLLLGCSVRWLSNTKALVRLFLLRKDVLDFLDTLKKFDPALKKEVTEPSFWNNVAFYCDITNRLCKLNIAMQGKNHNIFHHLEKVDGLIEDLKLLKMELLDDKLHGFPFCQVMKTEGTENFNQYSDLLENLIQDLIATFGKFDYIKEYEDDTPEKKNLLSVFPTTYRCEAAFSTMGQIKSSVRGSLSDARLTGSLRLALLDNYPSKPNEDSRQEQAMNCSQ